MIRTEPIAATLATPTVPRTQCGYVVDGATTPCGAQAAYRFRMTDWPAWRYGCTCPPHALVVRGWEGLAWMRTLTRAELADA